MNQSTLNKTVIAISLLSSFATPPPAFAFPGEAQPAEAGQSNSRGQSAQATDDDLKGYTNVADALPLYISENGPRMYRIGTGSRFVVNLRNRRFQRHGQYRRSNKRSPGSFGKIRR